MALKSKRVVEDKPKLLHTATINRIQSKLEKAEHLLEEISDLVQGLEHYDDE